MMKRVSTQSEISTPVSAISLYYRPLQGDRKSRGFTLIEVMILTAMISILLSAAFPAYQRYADNKRFAELMVSIEVYREAIAVAADEGLFSSLQDVNEGIHGIPPRIRVTETDHGIHVHDGVIQAEWRRDGSNLEGVRMEWTAMSHESPIDWRLGGSCLSKRYCDSLDSQEEPN